MTVATDTPFFPPDLVQRFRAALKATPSLLVARSGKGGAAGDRIMAGEPRGRARSLAPRGRAQDRPLDRTEWRVRSAVPDVTAGGKRIDPFFNINAPDQLAEAGALLKAEAARAR